MPEQLKPDFRDMPDSEFDALTNQVLSDMATEVPQSFRDAIKDAPPWCGVEGPHEAHDTGWYEPGKPRHHGFPPIRCKGVSA